MADEAVNPARGEPREQRWGTPGYAGEWVRATDAASGDRARWIDDGDEAPPAHQAEPERDSEGDSPVA